MVRTRDWKFIASETDRPELYFMDGKNVERENLFGNGKYNSIYNELKAEILVNWDYEFVWE